VVGARGLAAEEIEVKKRSEEKSATRKVAPANVVETVKELLK
jgi:hypothetical protein